MTHYSEDDLVLHYYGESRRGADVEKHLTDCAECGSAYREISGALALLTDSEVPERGDQYGLEVWQRIRHRLPEQERSWLGAQGWGLGAGGWGLGAGGWGLGAGGSGLGTWGWGRGLAVAGALAVLIVAAFVAGRVWPSGAESTVVVTAPGNAPSAAGVDEGVRDRILLTSVADHLERSDRMLTDIMNAPMQGDISVQQEWAEDLLQTSRLYRQDAIDAGERSVAAVLDELERNLIEIVHSPSQITAADLEQMRRRIDAAALLFKVRVMSDELRKREVPVGPADPQTSTRKIS